MRTLFISLCLLVVSSIGFGQDCFEYYPFEQDQEFTLETYDRKDKLEARMEYKVIERSGNTITYHATFYDKKGEKTTEMTFDIVCEDGLARIDMKNFMPQSNLEQMQSMESMEIEIEGEDLQFPQTLSPGMTLEDATMTMKAAMEGVSLMSTTVTISDRKVEGIESVTTPFGTFECFKISQTTQVKAGFLNTTSSEHIFIDPDKGFVKSVNFNKKGKLQGYTVRVQ